MSTFPKDYNLWPRIEVYGADFRSCLLDMATTISKLELWDWLKNYSPPENKGFMFCGESNVTKISNSLQDNSHSGATFGYCMRCMEYIAKNGFPAFHELHSNNV